MKKKLLKNIGSLVSIGYPSSLWHLSALGTSTFFLVVVLFFLLEKNYTSALFLFLGLFFVTLISIPLRLIFFRERPKKKKYNNVLEKVNAGSFPSNHAARSTFLFLFFVELFQAREIQAFFLLLVFLVLLSRVLLKRHYPKDLLGGVVLAFIVFWLLKLFF